MRGIINFTHKKVLAYICLLAAPVVCFGQSTPGITVINPIDPIKSMNLEYKQPSGFRIVLPTECFKSYPKLERIITCSFKGLESADHQFVVFVTLYRTLTENDSVFISKISDKGIKSLDWNHEANIRSNIEESLGKESAKNWRRHLNYYPAHEARRIFNADSAITYSIKLDPPDYYRGKYNHLDVLCITKKRRGVVFLFSFFTDEGKKRERKYQKSVERMFKYLD